MSVHTFTPKDSIIQIPNSRLYLRIALFDSPLYCTPRGANKSLERNALHASSRLRRAHAPPHSERPSVLALGPYPPPTAVNDHLSI
jgi:hypothetical protein